MSTSLNTQIENSKQRLRQACPELDDKIIDGRAPFIMRPRQTSKKGIILIHGLLDSCFILRDVAQVFCEDGYVVYGLLLPGHGTKPEDLLQVRAEDWISCVNQAIKQLSEEVDEISIGGFSTGANLSLLAAHQHDSIKKVYCFAPAHHIKARLISLSGFMAFLGKFCKRFRFAYRLQENDCYKYHSITYNGAYQVYRLSKIINKLTIKQPILLTISAQDETVGAQQAIAFFQKQSNPTNRALIFTNQAQQNSGNISYINSQHQNIISLSHHGLMNAPENAYYGEHGQYQLADQQHYHSQALGAVYQQQEIDKQRVSRVYFNKDFNRLKSFLLS